MRAGAAPVTSLLPTAAYIEYFEPCFKDGKDILFVAFSSQLSGTINNVYAAREELLAKYSRPPHDGGGHPEHLRPADHPHPQGA